MTGINLFEKLDPILPRTFYLKRAYYLENVYKTTFGLR